MMRYLFLILVLILPISLHGQSVYTAKSMSLKGKVKSVESSDTYQIDIPTIYSFDEQGRVISITRKGVYTTQYKYDTSNYPIKAVVISHDGIKRLITFETDTTHSFWKEMMREKGKLKEEQEYQSVSPTKAICIYRNHPIEVVSVRAYYYTDSTQTKFDYAIDEEDNHKEVYTYNTNGDIKTKKRYDLNDNNESLETYQYVYQYDSKGNWIQCSIYRENVSYPIYVAHRKITYYD